MHDAVKKAADSNNKEKIKFIFADCLDADPTFEKYQEDLDYCKRKGGLFDTHQELTRMSSSKSDWNREYWIAIKKDFQKNASLERLNHMREVAKVVYSEKIERLRKERSSVQTTPTGSAQQPSTASSGTSPKVASQTPVPHKTKAQQDEELREAREKLARENQRTNEHIAAQTAQKKKTSPSAAQREDTSKDQGISLGLAGTILAVLVVAGILAIIFLMQSSQQ